VLLTKHIFLFCCAEENHDYDLFGHSWSYLGFNNWGIFRTVKTSTVSRVSLFIFFYCKCDINLNFYKISFYKIKKFFIHFIYIVIIIMFVIMEL
jgi:hypothetical protein